MRYMSIATKILLWLAIGLLIIFSIKEFFAYQQLYTMQQEKLYQKSTKIKNTILSIDNLYQTKFKNGSNHIYKELAKELSKQNNLSIYIDTNKTLNYFKNNSTKERLLETKSNYIYQYPIKNQPSCKKCHNQPIIATINIKIEKKPLHDELFAILKQNYIVSTILNLSFFVLIYIFVIRKIIKNIALFNKKFMNFFDFLTGKREKIEKVKITSGDEIEKFAKEIDKNITITKNILLQKAKSEQELMKTNNLLQKKIDEATKYVNTVIETSANAIIVIDEHSTILTFNNAAEKLFGYTKEEMLNKNSLNKIIPKDQMPLYQNFINSFMKTKSATKSTCDLTAKTKDNQELFIHLSLGSSKVNDKTILVINITDVTKQKRDKKKILELNQALDAKLKNTIHENFKKDKIIQRQNSLAQMGEILTLLIHQIRQPITAIGAISLSMQTKIKTLSSNQDEFLEYLDKKLDKISENITYLSNTIDDFKNFFQPSKEPKLVKIDQLLQRAIDLILALLIAHEIKLKKDFQTDETILSYPNELLQAILNILKNAADVLIQNRVKDPVIEISLYQKYEEIIIEISDNGGGISQDIIDKIFNPYFSTKGEKIGTGLGLYVTKNIIQNRCKGTIKVKNKNKGAIFIIKLPKEVTLAQN